MSTIKCTCGSSDCEIAICFDSTSRIIRFRSKNGEYTAMHVDANAIVEIIRELKRMLMEMVNNERTY